MPYHHLGSVGRPTLLYNQPTAEISGPRVLEPRSARPDNDAPLKPFLLNPHSPIRSVSFSTPTDKKNGAAITLEIFPRFLPLQKEKKKRKNLGLKNSLRNGLIPPDIISGIVDFTMGVTMGLLKFSGKRLGRQLAWERKRELNNKRIILEIGRICALLLARCI